MATSPPLAIAIPARYGSTRFPGKPLAQIAGRSMLSRVVDAARRAVEPLAQDVSIFVTTEDARIQDHAKEIGVTCLMTSADCPTGSDRALAAMEQLDEAPDFILNLQGDAPFTPPEVIRRMFETFADNPALEVVTPIQRLSWNDLDRLRATKEKTPFSGTTAIVDANFRALWFSKNIIPAIRKEEDLRTVGERSPVYQHIGLYGFRSDILKRFCALPQGVYEQLEGLEQLRMLENGISIQAFEINLPDGVLQSGIDSPQDLERAEKMIAEHGEPF